MRGQNGTTVTMTTNGKNKAVETKICILGGPGVGKSGKTKSTMDFDLARFLNGMQHRML